MPRTAIISDIHGDLPRLHAVLADIAARNCTRIICLGDSVDERASGRPVLTQLLRLNIPSVLGNCDQLCNLPQGSPEQAFVDALPRTITEGDALFIHISPIIGARGLRDTRDAKQLFQGSRQRLCFVGHIHVPAIFRNDLINPDVATPVPFDYSTPIKLDATHRYAICVGAVGQSRDNIPAPRYAIWDRQQDTIEIIRVAAPT
jgi:predicted phosphodiesterase